MNALVTGGGGFLGSAIVRRLIARGDRVRSLSRGRYPDLDALGVEQVQGDVADAGAVDAAQVLIDLAVDDFLRANRARAMGPLIDGLYKRYHQLAQDELDRTLHKLPNVTEAEKVHLEELSRRIVNKLLHDPIHAIRQADTQHPGENQYLHAMQKLFKLREFEEPLDQTKKASSGEHESGG